MMVLLLSGLTVLSALVGAIIIFLIKLDHKKLCGLISFSAGGLFGAAVFSLIPESLHTLNTLEIILGISSGYLLFFFLTKYYSNVCPACSATHFDERTAKRFTEIVRALLVALSIHSFLDGVAVSTYLINSQNSHSSIFFAVLFHKLPEGLALASLMFSANYSKKKIIAYVFMVEIVTVLGALAGNTLLELSFSQYLINAVMVHIAGGFIFLASHAVLGEMLKDHKKLVVTTFLAGLILIFFIGNFSH